MEASTKRRILSVVLTFYDSLRFASPVILRVEKEQELWPVGIHWDDIIPEVIQQQWNNWTTSLNNIEAFKVTRALTSSPEIKDILLRTFCDASIVGFSCVVYMRVNYCKDLFTMNFVASKSHVAPLHPLAVSKLELQEAVVALRLVKFVQ